MAQSNCLILIYAFLHALIGVQYPLHVSLSNVYVLRKKESLGFYKLSFILIISSSYKWSGLSRPNTVMLKHIKIYLIN